VKRPFLRRLFSGCLFIYPDSLLCILLYIIAVSSLKQGIVLTIDLHPLKRALLMVFLPASETTLYSTPKTSLTSPCLHHRLGSRSALSTGRSGSSRRP